MAVARTAAEGDDEVASLYAGMHRGGRQNLTFVIDALLARGPLRVENRETAVTTLTRLVSPELFLWRHRSRVLRPTIMSVGSEETLSALLLPSLAKPEPFDVESTQAIVVNFMRTEATTLIAVAAGHQMPMERRAGTASPGASRQGRQRRGPRLRTSNPATSNSGLRLPDPFPDARTSALPTRSMKFLSAWNLIRWPVALARR